MSARVAIGLALVLCGAASAGEEDAARRERIEKLRARLIEVQAEERKLGGTAPEPAPSSGRSPGELQFERARRTSPPAEVPAAQAEPPPAPAPAREPEPAPPAPEATSEAVLPAVPARVPVQLADAQLAAGDAAAALESYRRSAEEAEAAGEPAAAARARYGMARALERLERTDEAVKAYLAVEGLAAAGPWAKAARFARGWIAWRQRLDQLAPGRAAR